MEGTKWITRTLCTSSQSSRWIVRFFTVIALNCAFFHSHRAELCVFHSHRAELCVFHMSSRWIMRFSQSSRWIMHFFANFDFKYVRVPWIPTRFSKTFATFFDWAYTVKNKSCLQYLSISHVRYIHACSSPVVEKHTFKHSRGKALVPAFLRLAVCNR